MPKYGWKPEFQITQLKKKVWGPPPNILPRKFLKRAQLIKKKVPPQRRDPTKDELRILYEREIYRMFNLHASLEELLKQYSQFKYERVCPGIIRAWLTNSYQGEVDANGMPEGQGSAQMARGVCYKGTFKNGLLHGHGVLQWGKDSIYEGNFYANCLCGKGIYNWGESAKYIGEIYEGVPHGIGIMEAEEGLKYEGYWEYGKREGQGKMTFGKLAVYEGNWKNDLKDGEGKLLFTTGSSYCGTWLEGKKHGQGHTQVQRLIIRKQKPPKGFALYSHMLALKGMPNSVYAHCYKGDWMGGLPHGSGRSEWPWDGKQEDKSILINSYVGSYENGMRHGEGSFFYASGAIFKGHWRQNMKVGLGVLVYETGKLHFGIFSHDHYNPISNPRLSIKEPLESALQLAEDDIQTARDGVWRAVMRHKNIIQDAFLLYCSIIKEPFGQKSIVLPPLEDDVQPKKDIKEEGKEKLSKKQSKESPKEKSNKKDSKAKTSKKEKERAEDNVEAKDKKTKDKKNKLSSKELPNEEHDDKESLKKPTEVLESYIPESPRAIAGRSRGMSNEQLWRLLHNGHMLQPGLGYAKVDRMLLSNDFSWDTFSDVHSNKRQIILRELVSVLIQIGLFKYQLEHISSEDKVERLLAMHLHQLEFVDNNSLLAKVELLRVHNVLQDNRKALDRLFCELLLESETPDYTIKLKALIQFGQSRRPQLDLPLGEILSKVALEVYGIYIVLGDDTTTLMLEQDINYREFETILLLFAITGEDLPELPDYNLLEAKKIKKINEKIISEKLEDHSPEAKEKPPLKEAQTKSLAKIPDTNNKSKVQERSKINTEHKSKAKEMSKNKSPTLTPPENVSPTTKIMVETSEKNVLDLLVDDVEEEKRKLKLREAYEIVLADLLKMFIVDEVAVYKLPKGVKGVETKSLKGNATKSDVKSNKKK